MSLENGESQTTSCSVVFNEQNRTVMYEIGESFCLLLNAVETAPKMSHTASTRSITHITKKNQYKHI